MPAQTKQELLAVTEFELKKLNALLDQVPSDFALEKDEEDTSIKDVIAHRAHWIDLFLGWYRDGKVEKDVHFPAPGYKWNELKAYNAHLRAAQSKLGWKGARAYFTDSASHLSDFLSSQSHEELYGAAMKGARNNWTTGRWAEAAGASHYRSATKYIRTRLREIS